eukprot:11347025-Alexandrium_andersonii.AAC.1
MVLVWGLAEVALQSSSGATSQHRASLEACGCRVSAVLQRVGPQRADVQLLQPSMPGPGT